MKKQSSISSGAAFKNDENRFTQKLLYFYSLCAGVTLPNLLKSKGHPNNKLISIHSKDSCNAIHIDSHRVFISDPLRFTPYDTKVSLSDK